MIVGKLAYESHFSVFGLPSSANGSRWQCLELFTQMSPWDLLTSGELQIEPSSTINSCRRLRNFRRRSMMNIQAFLVAPLHLESLLKKPVRILLLLAEMVSICESPRSLPVKWLLRSGETVQARRARKLAFSNWESVKLFARKSFRVIRWPKHGLFQSLDSSVEADA